VEAENKLETNMKQEPMNRRSVFIMIMSRPNETGGDCRRQMILDMIQEVVATVARDCNKQSYSWLFGGRALE
jgi:hypothetical protein